MNRPALAADLLGVIAQAEEALTETIRKLDEGRAVNGRTGMQKAKHILADARAREERKQESRAA